MESPPQQPENVNNETERESDAPENPSRRRFFGQSAALGAAVFNYGKGIEALFTDEENTVDKEANEKTLAELRETIRAEYGVELDFSPPHNLDPKAYPIKSEQLTLKEKVEAAQEALETLRLYPTFYIKKATMLTVLHFHNNLFWVVNGRELDMFGVAYPSAGEINMEHDTGYRTKLEKYVSPDTGKDINRMKKERRMAFHHELFHQIDPNYSETLHEESWLKATRGFVSTTDVRVAKQLFYFDEIERMVMHGVATKKEADEWLQNNEAFERGYGRDAPWEDRATIAEGMFLEERSRREKELHNEVYAKKRAFVKDMYYKKSKGVMDEGYWSSGIASGGMDGMTIREYWISRTRYLATIAPEKLQEEYKKVTGEALSLEEANEWQKELRDAAPKE